MTSVYVQKGDVLTIPAATGGVVKDTIYRGEEAAGVYLESATGGDLVPVAMEGVLTVTKAAGGGLDFAVLEKVYATTGATATPATGANNLPLGLAFEAAATGATTVAVKLGVF